MTLVRSARDLRVDFFRGVALWWIFIDHIPNNWVAQFSLRNFAVCDATEVFVLLAGYASGLAYGKAMDRRGYVSAAADVLKRAWTLYIAHIFLFVVFSAQVSYGATTLDRADYLDEIHLDVLGEAPYRAMLEALTLHFQPAYLNILPLYVVLLLLFALALPLLRRPHVLAALSLLVYGAARLGGWNFPAWTGGGWYFNPLTWQLLFILGAILSYAPGEIPERRRWIDAASVGVVLSGLVLHWLIWRRPEITAMLPPGVARVLVSVDKEGLHPFRLVSILAIAWLTSRVLPPGAAWMRSRFAAPFVLCGQHSLPVFCAGIFLSFLGRTFMEELDGAAWAQAVVNVTGAVALVGVGALAAWYRVKDQAPPKPSPQPALQAVSQPDNA